MTNPYVKSTPNRLLAVIGPVSLMLLVLAALRLSQWLMPFGAASTPDSLAYLFAARSLRDGTGIALPDTSAFGDGMIPLTLWPPLYPAWLALFLPLANDPAVAASLANGFALTALVMVTRALGQRWLPPLAATVFAVIVALLPSMQLIYTYAWSESLCQPLLMLCFHALLKSADAGAAAAGRMRRDGWLVVAATACALMIWTRYAAVAFVPLLGATVWWLDRGASRARRLWPAACAVALTLVLLVPLLRRNLAIAGHLSGGERGAAEYGVLDYLAGLWASFDQYVLGNQPWIVALLLICFGEALLRRSQSPPATDWPAPLRQDSAWLPVVWCTGYLAAIAAMGQTQHIDYDARMLSLITPLLATAVLAATAGIVRRGGGRSAWLPWLGWSIWSLYLGLSSLAQVRHHWAHDGLPVFAVMRQGGPVYQNFSQNPQFDAWRILGQGLRSADGAEKIYTDINPLQFRYVTGIAARDLPPRFDPDTIRHLNTDAGAHASLVASHSTTISALEALYGKDLPGLARLEVGTRLGIVALRLPLPAPVERVKGIEPSS